MEKNLNTNLHINVLFSLIFFTESIFLRIFRIALLVLNTEIVALIRFSCHFSFIFLFLFLYTTSEEHSFERLI